MKTRKELPQLFNSLNLLGEGVEVGVHRGGFSAAILSVWKGKKLHAVDPWLHQGVKMDISDESQEIHDENLRVTKETLSKFKGRFAIVRDFSISASNRFLDGSLDFVYLDARHDYRSIWSDLEVWYPKVRKGGIISGHDYKNSCVRKNLVEVKRAVDNFFLIVGGKIETTTEDNLPSWHVIK